MDDLLGNLVVDLSRIATRLFIACSALMLMTLISRWLDVRAGIPFKDVARAINKSPAASADYYGKRLIAVALVVVASIFG